MLNNFGRRVTRPTCVTNPQVRPERQTDLRGLHTQVRQGLQSHPGAACSEETVSCNSSGKRSSREGSCLSYDLGLIPENK